MKHVKVQFLAVLVLGASIGYVAATGPSRVFSLFKGPTVNQAAENNATEEENQGGCCDAGANRAQQLALADPRVQAASARIAADGKKPNIVFIMVDNLGWGELGCYGGGVALGAPTPRIDKLASQGMRLTNYNVETQCTPSRAALMTGRHPIRSGAHSVPLGDVAEGLTQWEITIAKILSGQGYRTGCFGKWHIGSEQGRLPNGQGFDEWYGIPRTTDEAMWFGSKGYDETIVEPPYIWEGKKGEKSAKVKKYDLKERRLIDAEITRRSIDFIQRAVKDDKPFFAYVPLTCVHYPALPHPDFAGKTGRGDYADMKVEMDHHVGEIIDVVDKAGIADNTIFVFTSDNGPEPPTPLGGGNPVMNGGSAGPWRGAMFTHLEGSLRTCFLIRWPGKVTAGRVSDDMVHTVDLLPTLARIAGGKTPDDRPIDGVDQTDFFLGKKKSTREGFPVYVGDRLQAVKWRNWKIHFYLQDRADDPPLKLAVPRVYDLDLDPREERDVAITNTWVMHPASKIVAEHLQSLKKYPPIPMGTPDPYMPPRP